MPVDMEQTEVVAVVLAAGLSRRMGPDNKLLLPVAEQPMVRHVVQAALASRRAGRGHAVTGRRGDDTPLVTAPAGAVAEVVGDAACIVAANEAGAWRAALAGLLDVPERCAQLTAAGLGQVRRYRWAETARQTLNVYRHVLGLQGVEGAA